MIDEISGPHSNEYEDDCFRDVGTCGLIDVYRRFRGAYLLHHQGGGGPAILPLVATLLSPCPQHPPHWYGQGFTVSDLLLYLACGLFITLMTEAATNSEMSVNFYQTTRPDISDDRHILSEIESFLMNGVYN
jgi:hypothetical protein